MCRSDRCSVPNYYYLPDLPRITKMLAGQRPKKSAGADKPIWFFEEGSSEMKNLLGGKGAGLAEMTRAGLPVPPGFTITTATCLEYYALGGVMPAGLNEQVRTAMAELERRTGKAENDSTLLKAARGRYCLLLNEDAELCDGAPQALLDEPRLNPGITRAFRVPDANIDVWKTVWALSHGAQQRGARVLPYHAVIAINRDGDEVTGARVRDSRSGDAVDIEARVTVNAAGAWAGQIADLAGIEGVRLLPGRGIMIAMTQA